METALLAATPRSSTTDDDYESTSDGACAIDRKTGLVHLRAMRGLAGLDFEEFTDILDTVGAVTDEWDDKLRAEYGGGPQTAA